MNRLLTQFVVACAFLFGMPVLANREPFGRLDLIPVKPTAAMNSGIALESASLPLAGSHRFSLLADLNSGILSLKLGDERLGDLIPFRADAHLMAAWAIHSQIELGLAVPLTLAQSNDFSLLSREGLTQTAPAFFGIGSVRLLPRFSLLDPNRFFMGLAAVTEVRLPSFSASDFIGDSGFVFAPRLLAEKAFGPVKLLANIGYRLRPFPSQFLNLYLGNEFVSGLGTIVDLPDWNSFSNIEALAEVHVVTSTEAPFTFSQADSLKTPLEGLLGLRANVAQNWQAQVYLGRGLSLESGYGRPAFRAIFGLSYVFEVADRDGDGVPDHKDGCPDEAEDKDGFEDADGCPDPDNDRDGVLDVEDICPVDPGPRELEGCPDRDGDGLADVVDKCPDEPGPIENEGCPVEGPSVELESDRLRINGQIQFETNEATIKGESFPMLDEVYQVLADNPNVGPVVIEGHTDNRGSRAYNLDLSRRRAKAVETYLVKKGIDKKRLRSAGYGFDRPISDNATPLGRAKNRRTEFRLVTEIETAPVVKPVAPAPKKKAKTQ